MPIKRGTRLIVKKDFVLRDVAMSAGSAVTVIQVGKKSGKIVSVGLELKDGHVLHDIGIRVLRKNFRPAKR